MRTIQVRGDCLRPVGRFWCGIAVLLLLAGPLAAQTRAEGPSSISSVQSAATPEYLILPDDVLDVLVLDVAELSRQYRVSAKGTVNMPLLSAPVTAAGLTLTQFSVALAARLRESGLVSDPHVTTSVQQSRLNAVAITGAVRKPLLYPVFGQTTLLDVLSQAEGLAEDASDVAIVHRGGVARSLPGSDGNVAADAAQTIRIDLKRALESGDRAANVVIYPGDRITVPRAGVVYVVGAVNKPGGFTIRPSKQGMTVLQALALAEDAKSTAVRQQAVIIRPDTLAADGHRQIPVNLNQVLAGKAADTPLQAEDILFVPDSTGKRALRRGLEAVLQTATGLAIYRR